MFEETRRIFITSHGRLKNIIFLKKITNQPFKSFCRILQGEYFYRATTFNASGNYESFAYNSIPTTYINRPSPERILILLNYMVGTTVLYPL